MAIYATKEDALNAGCDASRLVRVQTLEDGGWEETWFEMDSEVSARLDAAREVWAQLKADGTPYWCIHEGRTVSDPQAYWWDDAPEDAIYRKHGVRCAECGGYIQEG